MDSSKEQPQDEFLDPYWLPTDVNANFGLPEAADGLTVQCPSDSALVESTPVNELNLETGLLTTGDTNVSFSLGPEAAGLTVPPPDPLILSHSLKPNEALLDFLSDYWSEDYEEEDQADSVTSSDLLAKKPNTIFDDRGWQLDYRNPDLRNPPSGDKMGSCKPYSEPLSRPFARIRSNRMEIRLGSHFKLSDDMYCPNCGMRLDREGKCENPACEMYGEVVNEEMNRQYRD